MIRALAPAAGRDGPGGGRDDPFRFGRGEQRDDSIVSRDEPLRSGRRAA
jgi:hypothetical protein